MNATIHRDEYGVPHIFADTEADALRGFGYAQAEDRLGTLLTHYLAARGAAASVLGAGYLERDIAVRAYRLPKHVAARYGELPPNVRAGVEAFADGVNRYQTDDPAKCPAWAFPVTPHDVVSLGLMFNLHFATDHFETAQNDVPKAGPASFGSNAFAVAGTRTESGNAIVSLDPHLPIDGVLRWYEARVKGGALDVYGVAFVGVPYIAMGTNGRVAWANTVNAPDLSDLYEIRLRTEPGSAPLYEYNDGLRPCDMQTYTFKVRGQNDVAQTVLSTHYGPILRQENGKQYAVRKAGVGDVHALTQIRAQCLAQTVDEYRDALSGCHVVMFNHLFGDSTGAIGYVSAGNVPRRPPGYNFHAPVPGWTSATEWGDPLTMDELPQAIRPASGFLQNCNDSPAYCGADDMQVPPPYPGWLAPDVRTLRGDHMREMLTDDALSLDRAKALATDCTDLNARRELLALLHLVPLPHADPRSELSCECSYALMRWLNPNTLSAKLTADATGAALFQAWLKQPFVAAQLSVGGYLPANYASVAPLAERYPDECADALVDAAEWLRAYGYALDVLWGELHRLRRGTADLPCDGGLDSLVPNGGRLDEATGKTYVQFGSSFRAVIELHPDGDPEIWACLPWGNSDDPASPHYADQLPLAARREYRRIPWTREAVRAGSEVAGNVVSPQSP